MNTEILLIRGIAIYLALINSARGYCKVNVECFSDGTDGCCRNTGFLVTGHQNFIHDNQINASSVYHVPGFEPPKSRINNEVGMGAWLQANGLTNQWIQYNFGKPRTVLGIVTKGRYSYDEWVKSYEVKYAVTKGAHDAGDWNLAIYKIPETEATLIFPGNHDRVTPQVNYLQQPIKAQYIRIYPKTSNSYPSLRADIIGCFDNE